MSKVGKNIVTGTLVACLSLCAFTAQAQDNANSSTSYQPNFAAFELNRSENWSPLLTEDLNGDGLLDLIYGDYTQANGRELLIHYQDVNGDFPNTPQRIDIKSEIIAIGFGDLRDEPGTELILHAANGVFSLSAGTEGYADNLKPIMQFDSLVSIASQRRVEFLPQLKSRNGEQFPDLLLPAEKGFRFFRGNAEGFSDAGGITTVNDSLTLARRNNRETNLETNLGINAEAGISIKVEVARQNPFDDFVSAWDSNADKRALLDTADWIPNAVFADFDGDGKEDLAFINLDDNAQPQLNIAYQTEEGFSDDELWSTSFEDGDELQFADLNDDGRQDLYSLAGDGDEWEARFYLSYATESEKSAFNIVRPDQLMRFAGYDVRIDTLPLATGATALSVSYYTLPVVDAIRNASINRTQLLYAPEATNEAGGTLFARRPTSQLVESFSASNVRGLSEQMSLRYDIDGDGRRDALFITERGTLAAKKIDDNLQIATQAFWEYTSDKTVFEFEVLALNSDAIPDLILRHGNSITVLVSRGGSQ